MPKFSPIKVTRADAGGPLWAPGHTLNGMDVENGETPSHDRGVIQQRCDQLNGDAKTETPCDPVIDLGLARAYRDAFDVQCASNLIAVVNGWARACAAVSAYARARGHGTDWINKHPINVMFAQQVYHLTGNGSHYSVAYSECADKAKG